MMQMLSKILDDVLTFFNLLRKYSEVLSVLVSSPPLPQVHHRLLCLVCVQGEVVVITPPFVGCFISP